MKPAVLLMRVALAGSLLAAALAAPTSAGADVFGPISLASEGALGAGEAQQAEYAHDTAISENGRYMAFDGSIGGVTGVWRRDLQTGALEQVAGGDAELPSLSENGQRISFTTNEGASLAAATNGGPDGESKPEAVNVYVRDMSKAPTELGAFILASAVNGSEEALAYSSAGTTLGSDAVGRSAISASGGEVAFVTTAVSNLVRYQALEEEEEQKGETPKPHTPALQVAVRYLESRETVLVSRCYVTARCAAAAQPAVAVAEGTNVVGGALYPGTSAAFAPAPPDGEYEYSAPPGASISADGTTVAWMGEHVGEQAPLLPGEEKGGEDEQNNGGDYTEPLWRRIAPGSETSTERVTGGSDPSAPGCAESGETRLPEHPTSSDPCQGPFVPAQGGKYEGIVAFGGGETGDFVPRLSADGFTVAFISQSPLLSLGENFGRGAPGQPSDLYIADMRSGLTRDQALTTLTGLAGGESAGQAATAPIFDFDISPDGSQVAFVTKRTQFPLGVPAFVSPPAGEAGLNELFDVDLDNDTLTRVTHGYGGPGEPAGHVHPPRSPGHDPYEQPGDGVLSPCFSANGSELVFSSTASNLVYGDANSPPSGGGSGPLDGSDAFVTEREIFAPVASEPYVSPAPSTTVVPAWRLGVSALSQPNGSVLLYIETPADGSVSASARSAVLVRGGTVPARASGHARRRRAHKARAARRPARPTVATRMVAAADAAATADGEPVALVLRLSKPYAALASQRDGLYASVSVRFTASRKPSLSQTLSVTFARTAPVARRPHKASNRSAHGRGGRR
jgi:hypothetical protein